MKFRHFSLLAAMLLTVTCALAHDDATLDAMHAPHGGQLRMAGPYHFELVAKANELSVYVTDHGGTSISTAGVTGQATITSGKKKLSVPLTAVGDNMLKGGGEFALARDTRVMVSLTFPGKSPEMARFTPLKKGAADAMHHAM